MIHMGFYMIKMRRKRIILTMLAALSVIGCQENEKEPDVGTLPSSHSGILEGDAFHVEMQKAENGNAESMRNIAIHYESMGPDFSDLALKWMERAAEKDYLPAKGDVLSLYLARKRFIDAEKLFEEMRESGELKKFAGKHYGYIVEGWEKSMEAARRDRSNTEDSTISD